MRQPASCASQEADSDGGRTKVIQERIRSALKESGPFCLGGAPRPTPLKPKSLSSSSSNSSLNGLVINEEDGEMKIQERGRRGIRCQDSRSLLDCMKETVDEMRRRSVTFQITTPHADEPSPDSSRPLFAPVTSNLRRLLFQPELREVEDDEVRTQTGTF